MRSWVNTRGLMLLAFLLLFAAVEKVAARQFWNNNYEGVWGDVRVAASVAFALVVLVGFVVWLELGIRGHLRKSDRGGLLVLATGGVVVVVGLCRVLRFVYPE